MPRISDLDAAGTLNLATDVFPIVNAGVTRKITMQQALDQTGAIQDSETVGFDDTGKAVITPASSVQDALDLTDSALLVARSTGVQYGGIPSVNLGDPAAIDITAGAGTILDATDPENPVYTPVSWTALVGDAPPSGVSWYYVDSSGTVQNTDTEPTSSERRSRIYLCRVSVTGGAVTGFISYTSPLLNSTQTSKDLWDGLGAIRVEGANVEPVSGLQLALTSGRIILLGAGISNPMAPNDVNVSAASPATFRMVTRNGVVPSDVTLLPVGDYDLSGVVTAIPGASTRVSVFTVYLFGSSNLRVAYGQQYYTTIADAKADLLFRSFVEASGFDNAAKLGWIIAQKGATDLTSTSEAVFVRANKFGGLG